MSNKHLLTKAETAWLRIENYKLKDRIEELEAALRKIEFFCGDTIARGHSNVTHIIQIDSLARTALDKDAEQ